MAKPVGAMSGTGTTDLHPKVHSVSPRGTVGSSIVGLPNVGLGNRNDQPANITKINSHSPNKLESAAPSYNNQPREGALDSQAP